MTASSAAIRKLLLRWYRRHRRDLPWRREPTLYRVLLSEFMLQQTRVDQALPYFERFLARFPTLPTLAAASRGEVVKLWEGLGYYRRAAHLHETAKRLAAMANPGPDDLDGCPGIGPYTRAAIASIVWGRPWPVVDGNVNRVMARMLALPTPPQAAEAKTKIREALEAWIAPKAAGDFNQGLMELGATVCTPRNPACLLCPWQPHCRGFAKGHPEAFPVATPKKARPHRLAAAAVVRRGDGRILIAQRPDGGMLANLWEFPGDYVGEGETLPESCRRGIRAEAGLDVEIGEQLAAIRHGYSHFTVTMHFFAAWARSGTARPLGCQAIRWVRPGELDDYPFPRVQWAVQKNLANPSKQIAPRTSMRSKGLREKKAQSFV